MPAPKPWLELVLLTLMGAAIAVPTFPAIAQITPDNTLGAEPSVVEPLSSQPVDLINGGAARGRNLFHSFSQFNVGEGRGAYFFVPNASIENILARVTGGSRSTILGTIGTFGNAQPNLFLINPNGIFFGANASLDVGRSFVATTASGIQFGNQGVFSATNPEAPPLLTVNPSALLVNRLANSAGIINQSRATVPVLGSFLNGDANREIAGLDVPNGGSLLLISDAITLDQGVARSASGRVELGAVVTGTIGLTQTGNALSLSIPETATLGTLTLDNQAFVLSDQGGSAFLTGDQVAIANGSTAGISGQQFNIRANQLRIDGASTVGNAQQVDVQTNQLQLLGGSSINAATIAPTTPTAIAIQARDAIDISEGSSLFASGNAVASSIAIATNQFNLSGNSNVLATTSTANSPTTVEIQAQTADVSGASTITAFGQNATGNIAISAPQLTIRDQALIRSVSNQAGNGGGVLIQSDGTVRLNQGSVSAFSLSSGVNAPVQLEVNDLELQNNSFVSAGATNIISGNSISLKDNSFIAGSAARQVNIQAKQITLDNQAGIFATSSATETSNIRIQASEFINLNNLAYIGAVNPLVETGGGGGDIDITTPNLTVQNSSGINSFTIGANRAGNITLKVADTLTVADRSGILTVTRGAGAGGTLSIETGTLNLRDSSSISGNTFSSGNGGEIAIQARNGINLADRSFLTSGAQFGSTGNAGEITIETGQLQVSDGSTIGADTNGIGEGGDITIRARDRIDVLGETQASFFTSEISASAGVGSQGNSGNITIETQQLNVTNGGSISTETDGSGKAGELNIRASDTVTIRGEAVFLQGGYLTSSLSTDTSSASSGGNLRLNTRRLIVEDGGEISTSTSGSGAAGSLEIDATESIDLNGAGFSDSSIFSGVTLAGTGTGGKLTIRSPRLSVRNGAEVSTVSFGSGNAGEIRIDANEVTIDNGQITSSTTGNLGVVPRSLNGLSRVQDGNTLIITREESRFPISDLFGDLTVSPDDALFLEIVRAGGIPFRIEGDTIVFEAQTLRIALPPAIGNGGALTINARDRIHVRGETGAIQSESATAGRAGDVRLNTGRLTVDNGAKVSVASTGTGQTGSMNVRAEQIILRDLASLSAVSQQGDGGNISLEVGSLLLLRRASQISTTAGIARTSGNGGNIAIAAPSIVALPNEGSRISANAFTGSGGNVEISTQAIFGLTTQPEQAGQSAITASSQLGVQGNISINQPDVQPTQGTIELPTDLVDASTQIAQVCRRNSVGQSSGRFVVSGRGNVPPSPIDPLSESGATPPLATIESPSQNQQAASPFVSTYELVEAEGWIKDRNGKVMLVAKHASTPETTKSACPE